MEALERVLGQWKDVVQAGTLGSAEPALQERGHAYFEKLADLDATTSKISCRPWMYDDFLERLATFKPGTWFAKPAAISALQAARYGWINVKKDRLRCRTCKAELMLPNPPASAGKSASDAALHAKLCVSHAAECPWRDEPCDAGFLYFPALTPDELVEAALARLDGLAVLAARDALPAVKLPSAFADIFSGGLAGLAATARRAQQQHASACGGGGLATAPPEQVGGSDSSDDAAATGAAAALAVCGWQAVLGERGSKPALLCATCGRHVGTWNFLRATTAAAMAVAETAEGGQRQVAAAGKQSCGGHLPLPAEVSAIGGGTTALTGPAATESAAGGASGNVSSTRAAASIPGGVAMATDAMAKDVTTPIAGGAEGAGSGSTPAAASPASPAPASPAGEAAAATSAGNASATPVAASAGTTQKRGLATPASAGGSIKRRRLGAASDAAMNPLGEHRGYCPWATVQPPAPSADSGSGVAKERRLPGWECSLRALLVAAAPPIAEAAGTAAADGGAEGCGGGGGIRSGPAAENAAVALRRLRKAVKEVLL